VLRIGRVSLPNQVYLVTFTTRHRCRLFEDFERSAAVARALHVAAPGSGSRLIAWVLMPDHCHLLAELGQRESLSRMVGRIKAAMARAAHEVEPSLGSIWARGFHDHALRAEENIRDAARHVLINPVRAGLAARIKDYPYWNADWL
jgi:REP element-mobilizing transposase RayT